MTQTILLGVDTGGTFTDFVLWHEGRLRVHKVLSTPAAPEQAILQGVQDLGLDPAGLAVVHGSTVATNAVLEGKGARTLYIGNRGLKDLLAIGRQARADLYDLQPPRLPPPVPAELCLESGGRIAADGHEIDPLTDADLQALADAVRDLAPEAVAINLLFSFLDDRAERRLADRLDELAEGALFVSRSSEVLPLIGEYERGIATWLNARVGPVVGGYLGRLGRALPGARLSVMQSSGETVAAEQTARHAVRLLLSGPAGGLSGAGFVARAAGVERVLTFDMGGTSTDVAFVDGEPRLTTEGRIAGFPVAVPMVDMHTIGAGGGSIARVDAGGALLVGPESAGADPGPVCYGRGGTRPTVTDANLVLGRLRADAFLGGRMSLDAAAARQALAALGRDLGLAEDGAPEAAAEGVIRVANEHMARALRIISVQRGIDPRGCVLCSFGGAGGLHVCALADALGMTRALVPMHAGVLSALGMLVTPPGRLLTRTWLGVLGERPDADVGAALRELAGEGLAALVAEGLDAAAVRSDESLDLRYRGQSYTLNVRWQGRAATRAAFAEAHRRRYGHVLDLPVELVNLRVRLTAPPPAVVLPSPRGGGARRPDARVPGMAEPVAVVPRDALRPQDRLAGPAIVLDSVATTWVAPGWGAGPDAVGNLRLSRN